MGSLKYLPCAVIVGPISPSKLICSLPPDMPTTGTVRTVQVSPLFLHFVQFFWSLCQIKLFLQGQHSLTVMAASTINIKYIK